MAKVLSDTFTYSDITTPLPHILCYSALDVSSKAVCAKDDRHGWIGGKCRHLFAACSGQFLPNRVINPDEYEEDLELFSNSNASTENCSCMLKMCSLQVIL